MEQINKIELRGNVGSVRIQTFEGRKVARISVATNFAYKDKDGAAVIETSWHNVTAWEGKNIRDLENIKVGNTLYVTGRVRYQKYTNQDNQEKEVTEILASKVLVVDTEDGAVCEM